MLPSSNVSSNTWPSQTGHPHPGFSAILSGFTTLKSSLTPLHPPSENLVSARVVTDGHHFLVWARESWTSSWLRKVWNVLAEGNLGFLEVGAKPRGGANPLSCQKPYLHQMCGYCTVSKYDQLVINSLCWFHYTENFFFVFAFASTADDCELNLCTVWNFWSASELETPAQLQNLITTVSGWISVRQILRDRPRKSNTINKKNPGITKQQLYWDRDRILLRRMRLKVWNQPVLFVWYLFAQHQNSNVHWIQASRDRYVC